MAKNSTTDEVIVIGVDFGTTYSGVAWAYSRQPENIEVITNWDSELTHCSDEEKSPSLLKFGRSGKDEWGYTVTPDKDSFRWFKLLLLDEKDVDARIYGCAEFTEARQLRDASGKNAVEIVSKYLELLWNHAINNIEVAIGEDLLAKCRFDVIMTVPAIWPHYAQQRMEQAAEMAGILAKRPSGTTLLRFVSEPEAAALSTLGDQANKSTVEVNVALEECIEGLSAHESDQVGDCFVICDAGGGTVDLISYRVTDISPFTLEECVKGDGTVSAHTRGLCGGIFLDQNFLELVKKKVGTSWKNASKKQELEFMNDKWEHGIKRQFRGKPRTWRLDIPNSVTRSGTKKRMRGLEFETLDLLEVFDPVIQKIEALVKAQSLAISSKCGKEPKVEYVILVGGFGRNTYLRDRLVGSLNPETKVLQSQGSKPWVAICRGAVLYGLASLHLFEFKNVKVKSRVARMSYGVKIWEDYDFLRHSSEDMVFDDVTQTWKATNQMDWLLKQGQDLSQETRKRKTYFYQFFESDGTVSGKFYVSASHKPPTSGRDDSVTRLCTVNWNRKVHFKSLPKKVNCLGKPYRILKYDIEMTCDGRSVYFKVYYKGKAVAAHNVVVEYE